MKPTHKQQILKLLKEGYSLTKIQILEKTGCWNSGNEILKLRKEGYNIKTTMHTHKVTLKRFAVYSLVE